MDAIQKDTFYDLLESALNACLKHELKLIIGDFIAKIGKDNMYRWTIEMHSLHDVITDNSDNLKFEENQMPRLKFQEGKSDESTRWHYLIPNKITTKKQRKHNKITTNDKH